PVFSLNLLSNFSVSLSSIAQAGREGAFVSAIYPLLEKPVQGDIRDRLHRSLEVPAGDLPSPVVFRVHMQTVPERIAHLTSEEMQNPGAFVVGQPAAGFARNVPAVEAERAIFAIGFELFIAFACVVNLARVAVGSVALAEKDVGQEGCHALAQ